MKPFASYKGGKDAGGAAETIIGEFPQHSIFVEMCVGGGAIVRKKAPALRTLIIDDDYDVVSQWERVQWPGVEVLHGCGVQWMETAGRELPPDALVYIDPPYPHSTRTRRRLYLNEWTDEDHRRFLSAAKALPCSVAISTYPNAMYARELAGWRYVEFQAMTRGGVMRTEALYVRVEEQGGRIGRDHRFAGRDFRERERIKRKAARWVGKFAGMREAEQDAVLAALLQHRRK